MAITIKRNIPEFEDKLYQGRAKYYNLANFSGLNHNHNLFEVDQASFQISNNVYLNRNKTLISRPAIIVEDLPNGILDNNFKLVDIEEIGDVTIYVGKYNNHYKISAYNTLTKIVKPINIEYTNYHISSINTYIIIFNNVDALILNLNKYNEGWSFLRDMMDIPITKRIIGQNIFEYPKDQFTESYKEEYIWGENTLNILPEGDAKAIIGQTPKNLEWYLKDANLNTEYRILRKLNVTLDPDKDIISSEMNKETGNIVVTIARKDHMLLSLNGGTSFERILYPQNEGYKNIAGLSKNALYFYFVATDGVYQYRIGELNPLQKWALIKAEDPLEGETINNYSYWVDDNSFAFVTFREEGDTIIRTRLYYKHFNYPIIKYVDLSNNEYDPNTQANMVGKDLAPNAIQIVNDIDTEKMYVAAWLPSMTSTSSRIVWLTVENDLSTRLISRPIDKSLGTIVDLQHLDEYQSTPGNLISFKSVILDDNDRWWETKIVIGFVGINDVINIEYLYDLGLYLDMLGAPLNLQNAYIINKTISSVDGVIDLPTEFDNRTWLDLATRSQTTNVGQYFFIVLDEHLYTNTIEEESNVSIIYDYISDEPYTKIPDVSYSTTELYLAFDNNLKITANIDNGLDYKFSLPTINNHSFVSRINGIINVSTTEVAIFLKNQIYINMLVPDETLITRYEYLNTRLTMGIRLGDDIINTNDGMFTIYPTSQGLAALNYQPDVANTDQVVDYLTDKITDTWYNFYKDGNSIKLAQNEHYIWLSNGTTTYLLLDLRNMSWWKLTSPVPVFKIITEIDRFNIVSNGLYTYDSVSSNYRDLHTTSIGEHIEWNITSQLLHLDAINYFKNIKQIVYQLEESNLYRQSLISTIQLYRKIITDKEPETILFNIEGYRTFVKRFNYWKVNLLQWSLKFDPETESPTQLRINGLAIKYEISEEVR